MSATRWDPGFLQGGTEFERFWSELAADRDSKRRGLIIAGRGFDPRTTTGPSAIASTPFPISEFLLIRLTNPQDSPGRPRNRDAATNEEAMRALFPDAPFRLTEIAVRDASGRLVGSTQIRTLLADRAWLAGFTDVIVDITALPISVAFPLLGTLISAYDTLCDEGGSAFNLHCIVCENTELDERILAEGGDDADYIDPFRGRGGLAAEAKPITIWAPVLGERQQAALRKIREMLGPAEVKPFLPSRRATHVVGTNSSRNTIHCSSILGKSTGEASSTLMSETPSISTGRLGTLQLNMHNLWRFSAL